MIRWPHENHGIAPDIEVENDPASVAGGHDPQLEKAVQVTLEALKKNDRVITIGGIYGVVNNVQRDSDQVTITVDEGSNTKLRVTYGAIARVIPEQTSGDKPA